MTHVRHRGRVRLHHGARPAPGRGVGARFGRLWRRGGRVGGARFVLPAGFLAKVNLSYAYANGLGRASRWRRRLEKRTKEEPRVTNGTVDGRGFFVCVVRSRWPVLEGTSTSSQPTRPASRLKGAPRSRRRVPSTPRRPLTIAKRVVSRCRASLRRSIALSLHALNWLEGRADGRAIKRSNHIFFS